MDVRDEEVFVCASACPVSYTHLDVYKRQAMAKHLDGSKRRAEFIYNVK